MDDTDPDHLSRSSDPETSKKTARKYRRSRRAQKWQLLMAHGNWFTDHPDTYDGLTCDEAWEIAGNTWPTASCYWHRHGDLEKEGYLHRMIDPATGKDKVRPGFLGEDRLVLKLTQEGWDEFGALRHAAPGS